MSYAALANLPPINGLYTAVLPSAVYTFFGSSLQLAVGPVALVSLLQAELINKYNITPGSADSVDFAGECAVAIGLILIIMSLLNLGNLIRFISHPVMSAFTTAAACLIGQNQLKSAFGFVISPPQAGQKGYEWNYQVLQWYIDNWNLNDASTKHHLIRNFYATRICFALYFSMLFFVLLKQYIKPTPERKKTWAFTLWSFFVNFLPLIAIVIGAHLAWQIKHSDHYSDKQYKHHSFYKSKLSIVGIVKPGLDILQSPSFKWDFGPLLGDVFPTALILFMESWSVAQRIAIQNNQLHLLNPSQELWSVGAANMLASVCSAYPVAGSFSRSSLNQSAGAKTPMSKVTTMVTVILTLRFLTRTFQYIPNCALAAVIWIAIFNLVNLSDFWHAWKHCKKDFIIMVVTFVTVYVTTTGVGLAAGLMASLLGFLFDTAFSDENAPLLVSEHENHRDNVVNHVQLRQDINFLTAGRFMDFIANLVLEKNKKMDDLLAGKPMQVRVKLQVQAFLDKWLKPDLARGVERLPSAIVVDMALVRHMDLTALEAVLESSHMVRSKKVTFTLINPTASIAKSLAKLGFQNEKVSAQVEEDLREQYMNQVGDTISMRRERTHSNAEASSSAASSGKPVKTIEEADTKVYDMMVRDEDEEVNHNTNAMDRV